MMQSTENGACAHFANDFGHSGHRRVPFERLMCSVGVVVLDVLHERPKQVPPPERDDVIRALPAKSADDSLGKSVLPGTPGCGAYLVNAQRLHDPIELPAVDPVTIPMQQAGRFKRERLQELPRGPGGRRMLGDVYVQDLPASMRQNDKHIAP